MKSNNIRTVTAAVVFVILCVGLVTEISMGTLSGFGWDTISMLCPLGAITTMIATKTLLPRALVSLAIMAVLVFLFGRAFCGWVCPIPLLQRIGTFFQPSKKRHELNKRKNEEVVVIAKSEMKCTHDCSSCSSCASKRAALDSRHYVLGGALLSTAIFGFPVFCLICPIGLTFASVLVLWRLFAMGDMTWSVVLIPAILVVELVFLKKWCTRFCPLSALMNLIGRFSKTTTPVIDDALCLETAKDSACSRCAAVCEADINLRHPDFGERGLADCTRCRACVDACPAHAISMPLVARKKDGKGQAYVEIENPVDKTVK